MGGRKMAKIHYGVKPDIFKNAEGAFGRRCWRSKSAEGGHEKPRRSCSVLRMGKLDQPQGSCGSAHVPQVEQSFGMFCGVGIRQFSGPTRGHLPSVHEVLAGET